MGACASTSNPSLVTEEKESTYTNTGISETINTYKIIEIPDGYPKWSSIIYLNPQDLQSLSVEEEQKLLLSKRAIGECKSDLRIPTSKVAIGYSLSYQLYPSAKSRLGKIVSISPWTGTSGGIAQNLSITSNYFPEGGYPALSTRLEPLARILLCGVYDDNNPLSVFRGMRYLIKSIWEYAGQLNHHFDSPFIEKQADPIVRDEAYYYNRHKLRGSTLAFKHITRTRQCYSSYPREGVRFNKLKFPDPLQDELNINMMPILLSYDEIQDQLPSDLHGYIPWIIGCGQADPGQFNKICYLTIHESFVEKGKSQRRPGLHIELPGDIAGASAGGKAEYFSGWGGGYEQQDGIFMASNVDDTCAAWNCRIIDKETSMLGKLKNIGSKTEYGMDSMGGIEHLRMALPKDKKYLLKKNRLYWMTDRTPHEALPMKEDGWRQFFRLVGHKLDVWYEDHSTKNPMGIVPDPNFTKIVKGNKFEKK